jgi:hypothetical protein
MGLLFPEIRPGVCLNIYGPDLRTLPYTPRHAPMSKATISYQKQQVPTRSIGLKPDRHPRPPVVLRLYC